MFEENVLFTSTIILEDWHLIRVKEEIFAVFGMIKFCSYSYKCIFAYSLNGFYFYFYFIYFIYFILLLLLLAFSSIL